jgi:putative oxidoreductase
MEKSMADWVVLIIRVVLTAAFLAAGVAKLAGAAMMVATFETIGWGQWFRYVTGLIEVGAAVLLWVPGLRALAALALVCTMIGAVIAHLAVLGPSPLPAAVLGVLAAVLLWRERGARA